MSQEKKTVPSADPKSSVNKHNETFVKGRVGVLLVLVVEVPGKCHSPSQGQ